MANEFEKSLGSTQFYDLSTYGYLGSPILDFSKQPVDTLEADDIIYSALANQPFLSSSKSSESKSDLSITKRLLGVSASKVSPENYLTAIFGNERGKLNSQTSLTGPQGQRATATGTYQITEGTRKGIYNNHFKSAMSYAEFDRRYRTDPRFEKQVALSLADDHIKGSKTAAEALGKWYSPKHVSLGNWNMVPNPEYGNHLSVGQYVNRAGRGLKYEEGGEVMSAKQLLINSANGVKKFEKGGIVDKASNAAIAAATGAVTNEVDDKSLFVYKNNTRFPSIGKGCSQIVSDELQKMGGSPVRTDAWFLGDAIVKNNGTKVFGQGEKMDYKKFKVGDVVTLDRPGTHYEKQIKENNPNKFKAEPVEHSGVVVGFNRNGVPLIKHGGVDEDIVVQPIDKLSLEVNSTGTILNYTVYGAYRTPEFKIKENYFTQNYKDYSEEISKTKPLIADSKDPHKVKFIKALNDNLENQSRNLGLSAEETQQLQKVAYGVFGNETKFGNSKVAPIKEAGKRVLYGMGLTDNSPSLGDTRLKYDDIYNEGNTRIGKSFDALGVKKEKMQGFKSDDDYNDEVNATVAILADNFKKLKQTDEYGRSIHNFNPAKNTVYDGVPIGMAVAKLYNRPSVLSKDEYFNDPEKNLYGKNAYEHLGKEIGFPVFPINANPVKVYAKENPYKNYPDPNLNNTAEPLPKGVKSALVYEYGGKVKDDFIDILKKGNRPVTETTKVKVPIVEPIVSQKQRLINHVQGLPVDKVTKTVPRTKWENAKDIVSNPVTSFQQAVNNQPVTGRGERNNYDMAMDFVNPAFYAGAIKRTVGNIVHPIETTKKLGNILVGTGSYITGDLSGEQAWEMAEPGVGVVTDALMTKGAVNSIRPAMNFADKFSKVGKQLEQIKSEGLNSFETAQKQLKEVGITSNQRKAYTPVISNFLDKYIYPYGYDGVGGKNKITETINLIKKGGVSKTFGEAINPQRADAWKMYLGKPQTSNTFKLSGTAPVNHAAYPNGSLKNIDIYSLNNVPEGFIPKAARDPITKNISSNARKIETALAENEIGYNSDPNVMGGYNVRIGKNGIEYNDIWDLEPSVNVSKIASKVLDKVKPFAFDKYVYPEGKAVRIPIKVEKIIGKPFMSHDVADYTKNQLISDLKKHISQKYKNNKQLEIAIGDGTVTQEINNLLKKQTRTLNSLNKESNFKDGGRVKTLASKILNLKY